MGQAMFKNWNGFRGPVLGPQSSHFFETCGEAFNVWFRELALKMTRVTYEEASIAALFQGR